MADEPETIPAADPGKHPLLQSEEAQAILAEALRQARAVAALDAGKFAGQLLPAALGPMRTPGWKTSEFWMVVATNLGIVAAALAGALPPQYAAIAAAVSQVAYSLSRGLAKIGS